MPSQTLSKSSSSSSSSSPSSSSSSSSSLSSSATTQTTPSPSSLSRAFAFFDMARVIFMYLVLVGHAHSLYTFYVSPSRASAYAAGGVGWLVSHGGTATLCMFVISGFFFGLKMQHPAFSAPTPRSLLGYIRNRLIRLLPMNILGVSMLVTTMRALRKTYATSDILRSAALAGVFGHPDANPHEINWSTSVDLSMQILACILLAVGVRPTRHRHFAFMLVAAFAMRCAVMDTSVSMMANAASLTPCGLFTESYREGVRRFFPIADCEGVPFSQVALDSLNHFKIHNYEAVLPSFYAFVAGWWIAAATFMPATAAAATTASLPRRLVTSWPLRAVASVAFVGYLLAQNATVAPEVTDDVLAAEGFILRVFFAVPVLLFAAVAASAVHFDSWLTALVSFGPVRTVFASLATLAYATYHIHIVALAVSSWFVFPGLAPPATSVNATIAHGTVLFVLLQPISFALYKLIEEPTREWYSGGRKQMAKRILGEKDKKQ